MSDDSHELKSALNVMQFISNSDEFFVFMKFKFMHIISQPCRDTFDDGSQTKVVMEYKGLLGN
jgi:hypothetical protein